MGLPELDVSAFFFINTHLQNGLFDVVMPFLSNNPKLLFLPLLAWMFAKEGRKAWPAVAIGGLAFALADSGGNTLKYLIARPRPCSVLEGIHLLAACGKSFSMPSNHAVNSFAVATAFWLLRRDFMTGAYLLVAAAIGLSRVYVGVHYPADVLAGALLGVGAAFTTVALSRRAAGWYREGAYGKLLLLIILFISMFRIYYIQTGPFDLSADEAHYWEWSRRLDWSYYSKGPMIAYLIYAGTALFGNTVLGVRIFAVLLSALSSLALYELGRRLYGARVGFFSAVLVQAVPLYSVYGVLMTIDSPFILFWILSLLLFWKAVDVGPPEEPESAGVLSWVLLGAAIGLGLLAKYTMAFFYLCGLLYFVSHKDGRKFLLRKGPYVALAVSLLVFSPVIIWNAAHGWATLKHTAGQAHLSDGFVLSLGNFFDFLGSQLGVVTPVLLVLLLYAVWKMRRDARGAFLFWFSVPVIAFFALKSIQGKVQGNWALPAYAAGFVAFSAYFAGEAARAKKSSRRLVAVAVALALAVTVVAYYPALAHLPPKLDPTMKLLGWKQLGGEADGVFRDLAAEGPLFIFSDSYQISSELAFYMKGNPVTYCVNLGRRMDQYDLWPGFEKKIGYNAVFVAYGDRDLPEDLAHAFARSEKVPVLIVLKRNRIRKFTVFKCYDFKGMKSRSPETY
jgi:4-amino-4-deoxy-L-arabinose transferase-like glycosyltransferase/membrane-associated phospholipid phosphatase